MEYRKLSRDELSALKEAFLARNMARALPEGGNSVLWLYSVLDFLGQQSGEDGAKIVERFLDPSMRSKEFHESSNSTKSS